MGSRMHGIGIGIGIGVLVTASCCPGCSSACRRA